MKHLILTLAVVLAPVALAAQQPADTGGAEAGRLREQVERAWNSQVQEQLKLSSDQAAKLRDTQEKFGAQRRALAQQQVERRRALNDQMQPGLPANPDSVNKLMDGMRSGREQMVKIDRDEDQEMSRYLNPVQRARYQQMRERLMQRVGELRMERRESRGAGVVPGRRFVGPRGGRRRGM